MYIIDAIDNLKHEKTNVDFGNEYLGFEEEVDHRLPDQKLGKLPINILWIQTTPMIRSWVNE